MSHFADFIHKFVWPSLGVECGESHSRMPLDPPAAASVIIAIHHAYCAACNARGERGPDEFGIMLQAAVDALIRQA